VGNHIRLAQGINQALPTLYKHQKYQEAGEQGYDYPQVLLQS
jgi:hypothetical protein